MKFETNLKEDPFAVDEKKKKNREVLYNIYVCLEEKLLVFFFNDNI